MKPLCIISGGTSGIGFEIAKNLAPKFRLALIYRSNHERAQASLLELSHAFPGEQRIFSGDLSDAKQTEKIDFDIASWDARVPAVLINCAGAAINSFFIKDPLEYQVRALNDNLISAMTLTHFIAKKMFVSRVGKIINFSSISAVNAFTANTSYSVAKAGVEAFTRSLASELNRAGVTVNCIRPGLVKTPMTEAHIEANLERLKDYLVPMESIISTVDYLLDPRSHGVTGTTLQVGVDRSRLS